MSIFDETPQPYLNPAIVELHAGFDAASQVPLSTLDIEELDEFLVEAYKAKQRADGLFAAAVLEATNQQLSKRHGEPFLSTHIAGRVRGNSKRIGAELSTARWLYRFPQLHAALTAGDVTAAHINELRDLERKHPKASPYMEQAQDFFIDGASRLQFPQWVDSVGYWFKYRTSFEPAFRPWGAETLSQKARRERSSRSDQADFRGCRPEVSTC